MIIDLQTRFSGSTTAAGVTTGDAVTATAISSNVIDLRSTLGNTPTLVDEGVRVQDLALIVQADQSADFAAAGAATLTITLESDSTANLATAPTVHLASGAIPKAKLVKGFVAMNIDLPADSYQRFLGTRYTVATGPFTAGGILAYLTPAAQRNLTYPIGFGVQ